MKKNKKKQIQKYDNKNRSDPFFPNINQKHRVGRTLTKKIA